MVFLISSIAAIINLDTSLNQQSLPMLPWSLIFYLYVKVLLDDKVCFDLMLLWILVNVTCIVVILGTLYIFFIFYVYFWHYNEIIFPKILPPLKLVNYLPNMLESYGSHYFN